MNKLEISQKTSLAKKIANKVTSSLNGKWINWKIYEKNKF